MIFIFQSDTKSEMEAIESAEHTSFVIQTFSVKLRFCSLIVILHTNNGYQNYAIECL